MGNTYVSNYHGNSITEYAAGANGPVAPINEIKGARTGIDDPSAITVRYVAVPASWEGRLNFRLPEQNYEKRAIQKWGLDRAFPFAGVVRAGANVRLEMQEADLSSVSFHFGELLRHYRLAAGLSQEALAERARMSPFAISALERAHRRRPQSKTLALLAEALGLDADQRAQFEALARPARTRLRAATAGPSTDEPTAPAAPNNLPRQLTPLIGRANELNEVASLAYTHPLTTLTGAGGVGKTRLAIAVGEALLGTVWEGVWFVELASFDDTTSTAQALGSIFNVRETQTLSLLNAILQYLRYRRLLLVVDNCEHRIDDVARVVDAVLREAPNVRILATSREPLRVTSERVYRVTPLATPRSKAINAKESRRYGAVELFVERAEAADAAFRLTDDIAPAIGEICKRLDGIPLAIELAAARTRVLSVTELLGRLDERFSVLAGGGRTSTPRQQTLRALIDWSYDLLPATEKRLFRMLSVFSGGFSIDSFTAMVGYIERDMGFDVLASLVEKSLVHAETIDGKTRFRLLESTRVYAADQLGAHGERDAAALAHAQAYLALAESLESQWDATPDIQWKANAEPELENWRAALRWGFVSGGDLGVALRLIVALRPVWFTLAPAEGLAWVRAGLGACGESQPQRILAWLELSAAHLEMVMQRYGNAAESAERALAGFFELGEKQGRALARLFAGAARAMLGDAKEAQSDLRVALNECRALGSRRAVGAALLYLGALELDGGNAHEARRLFAEALTLFKTLGASRPAAHVALSLAELEFKSGNHAEALLLANEALEADGALNDPDAIAYDLCNLAAYEIALHQWQTSASHAREALALARERGMISAVAWAIQHLAAVAALQPASDTASTIEWRQRAARLLGFVDARVAQHGLHRDFTERCELEQILTAVRDALGADANALLEEGGTWNETRAFEETSLV